MTNAEPIGMERVLQDIKRKRQRQVVVHGWSRRHDDEEHNDGSLATAAIPYIQSANRQLLGLTDEELQVYWPWAEGDPNLNQPRRELLLNAAALLVAEIERLDRQVCEHGWPLDDRAHCGPCMKGKPL